MRPLSEATSRIAGKSFSRKYISLGRIVTHWEDIVGRELSGKAQPVKIRYQKYDQSGKKKKGKPDATLEIAASSADATLLHYQKDLILERINQIFGERWITAIRFVAIAANAPPPKAKKRRIPLTAAEKNTLSGMLENIEDEDIRSRLKNLGQAVIMDKKAI